MEGLDPNVFIRVIVCKCSIKSWTNFYMLVAILVPAEPTISMLHFLPSNLSLLKLKTDLWEHVHIWLHPCHQKSVNLMQVRNGKTEPVKLLDTITDTLIAHYSQVSVTWANQIRKFFVFDSHGTRPGLADRFFELFSDWMRYNPMANEFVRKVNVRVAIHQNVAECGWNDGSRSNGDIVRWIWEAQNRFP